MNITWSYDTAAQQLHRNLAWLKSDLNILEVQIKHSTTNGSAHKAKAAVTKRVIARLQHLICTEENGDHEWIDESEECGRCGAIKGAPFTVIEHDLLGRDFLRVLPTAE
jgi:hypothetical protein